MCNDNNSFQNMLNLLSLIVGFQNLQENREQSAHNDIQRANDRQAQYILEELKLEFQKQNETLDKILKLLEEIKDVDKT